MIVARLSCTCYASASPPVRPDLKLTTPACDLRVVRSSSPSWWWLDVVARRARVLGATLRAPSSRARRVGTIVSASGGRRDDAPLLGRGGAALPRWWMGDGGAVGRREADGWRRAAAGWPSGAGWGHGRAEGVPGAPPGLQRTCDARGGVALAFCSVLLDIVFAHVRVSMCARTYSKVKVVSHSRLPGHVVDGRARSGERSSELWTGVESRDL